ncbi:hypothetical protein QA597_05410 [Marinilabiliaceae bacterium ANBcel2]|nr:hypothetical protein [Marinilabiliaceae bacterium ANBcel2]
MRRVLIFVPDGTGLRNYLFSDIPSLLISQGAEVSLVTSLPDSAVAEVEKVHGCKFKVYPVPYYKESFFEKFFRELETISRLRFFSKKLKNPELIPDYEWGKLLKYRRTFLLWLFYFFIKFISRVTSNYPLILKINRKYQNRVLRSSYIKSYYNLVDRLKPDVVLCTHQRALFASPFFLAARKRGVKTVTAVYSWDNLPKARMPLRADKYLVWSSYMKDEMKLYYPEIPESDVIITGTPQFEFYNKEDLLMSKEQFFREYHLDFSRSVICYSGGDLRTSPYDHIYLDHIACELQVIEKEDRPLIFFRRSPVDVSDRFVNVLNRYPEDIISVDPLWKTALGSGGDTIISFPLYEDVKLLVNIALHCNVVCNVGSTMAHDYSMFDKPACYINYNPVEKNGYYSVDKIYRYQHFRSMPTDKVVEWINSRDEIRGKIMNSINDPSKVAVDRKKWLMKIVHQPVDEASLNIVSFLMTV